MRWGLLILFGLFFLGIVSAIEAETKFTVGGCKFLDSDGLTVNILMNKCSIGGSTDGMFFCDNDEKEWYTLSQGRGCSKGQTTYILGSNSCCPSGYWCNETAPEVFQCQKRTSPCSDQLVENDCKAQDCIWMEGRFSCVDSLSDFGCEYYNSSFDCTTDIYNLSQTGIGSDLLGTNIECDGKAFSILASESKCSWNPAGQDGQKCTINYTASQTITPGAGFGAKFSCSNVYSLGDCLDGKQSVSWSSTNSSTGFSTGVSTECLRALNCDGGETTRFCGEPPIKLSGFSLFAFLASLSIIGIFYLLKEKQYLYKGIN